MTDRRLDYEAEADLFLGEYEENTGVGITPPVPVEQMIEVLTLFDILYDSSELSEAESGRIDFARNLITIRDDEIRTRQRFSLAHEAGHLRLHAAKIDLLTPPIPGLFGEGSRPHLSRRDSKEWHEVEANRFAAALLMPLKLLRPASEQAKAKFMNLRGTPPKLQATARAYLASQFQVSGQAMDLRLKTTGLAAELLTDRLF